MANKTINSLDSISQFGGLKDNDSFIIYANSGQKGTYKISYSDLKNKIIRSIRNGLLEEPSDDTSGNENIDFYLFEKDNDNNITKKISLQDLSNIIIQEDSVQSAVESYFENNEVNVKVAVEEYLGDENLQNVIPIGGNSVDLDEVTELGRWYCASTEDCENISNRPIASYNVEGLGVSPTPIYLSAIFNMIVEKITNTILRQTIRPYNSDKWYERDATIGTNIINTFIQQDELESFNPNETYYEDYTKHIRHCGFPQCWEDQQNISYLNYITASHYLKPKITNPYTGETALNIQPLFLKIYDPTADSADFMKQINTLNNSVAQDFHSLDPTVLEDPWTLYGCLQTGSVIEHENSDPEIPPYKQYFYRINFNEQTVASTATIVWQLRNDEENNVILTRSGRSDNPDDFILQIVFSYKEYEEAEYVPGGDGQGGETESTSSINFIRGNQRMYAPAGQELIFTGISNTFLKDGSDIQEYTDYAPIYGETPLKRVEYFVYDFNSKHIITQDITPLQNKNYYILETTSENTYDFSEWQTLNFEEQVEEEQS